MLMNCKPGCAERKNTTDASLDISINEVVCNSCGEILPSTSFVKNTMKYQGDILRKDTRQSFQFDCSTCNKKVKTEIINDELKGISCQKDCQFNVSEFVIHAMKEYKIKNGDVDE